MMIMERVTNSQHLTSITNPHVAGVEAVVFPLWSVPNNVAETFHFHFYHNLQSGSALSRALHSAKIATKKK